MTCYRKSSNTIYDKSSVDVVCPGTRNSAGYSSCCFHGDECLSGGICRYSHSLDGGSGYYMQDCTDPTYRDTSVCPQACTDMRLPDIVYNYQTQQWLCCGTDAFGNVTCPNPTKEAFNAPPPEQLVAANKTSITTTLSSSFTSSTHTSTPNATISSAAGANAQQPSTSGLTSGQAAAIGVGVTLGVILFFVVFFCIWWRRRRTATTKTTTTERRSLRQAYLPQRARSSNTAELSSHSTIYEKDSSPVRSGLEYDTIADHWHVMSGQNTYLTR